MLKISRETPKALIIEDEGAVAVAVSNKPDMFADGDMVRIYFAVGGVRFERNVPFSNIEVNGLTFPSAIEVIGKIADVCADFKPGGGGGTPLGGYPPAAGIPKSDLSSDIISILNAAESASQPGHTHDAYVPVSQGAINAGKLMGIDAAGDVVPVATPEAQDLSEMMSLVKTSEWGNIASFDAEGQVEDSKWSLVGMKPVSEALEKILSLKVA